jgi:hypothetical protein
MGLSDGLLAGVDIGLWEGLDEDGCDVGGHAEALRLLERGVRWVIHGLHRVGGIRRQDALRDHVAHDPANRLGEPGEASALVVATERVNGVALGVSAVMGGPGDRGSLDGAVLDPQPASVSTLSTAARNFWMTSSSRSSVSMMNALLTLMAVPPGVYIDLLEFPLYYIDKS